MLPSCSRLPPPQDAARVFADASEALAAAVDKQRRKVGEAEAALADAAAEAGSAGEKRREELSTNLAQEQLLLGKQEAAAAALAAAGQGAGVAALLQLAGDALAEALDRQLGATVTDPAIFRAHAAKWVGGWVGGGGGGGGGGLRKEGGALDGGRMGGPVPGLRSWLHAACSCTAAGRRNHSIGRFYSLLLPLQLLSCSNARLCPTVVVCVGMRPSFWTTWPPWGAACPPC